MGEFSEGGDQTKCSCNGRLVHASWCPMDKVAQDGTPWMPSPRTGDGFGGIEPGAP
jgi:hypothetical protein